MVDTASLTLWACPECKRAAAESKVVGIEYAYGSPNRYDGVSEWLYPCGHRFGRWSKRLLQDGEEETREARAAFYADTAR